MGEISAAGDIVTGALVGRAVEPTAGEGGGHGDLCLNCGTALIGPHCHQCGQAAHIHRSLGAIGHDLLHGVLHFEGKLWRTLPLLAWRPGQLMRRYIDGERARFVSPIALFLFSIFALFAIFSLIGVTPNGGIGPTPKTVAEAEGLKADLRGTREQFVAQRAGMRPGSGPAIAMDERITALDKTIAEVAPGKVITGPISTDIKIETGWERLDHGMKKVQENPSLALYKLQSNSYKFSWLLILLSIPFVWLMFAWKRQFHLYDHAIFVTLSIAFMSLLFITLTVLAAIGLPGAFFAPAITIIVPLHMYRELKDGYALSRAGALWRTAALVATSVIVLLVFVMLIVALGVLG